VDETVPLHRLATADTGIRPACARRTGEHVTTTTEGRSAQDASQYPNGGTDRATAIPSHGRNACMRHAGRKRGGISANLAERRQLRCRTAAMPHHLVGSKERSPVVGCPFEGTGRRTRCSRASPKSAARADRRWMACCLLEGADRVPVALLCPRRDTPAPGGAARSTTGAAAAPLLQVCSRGRRRSPARCRWRWCPRSRPCPGHS